MHAARRWLTGYQQGSIFGAIIVAIAFAAAFSTLPRTTDNSATEKRNMEAKSGESNKREQESFWRSTTVDPTATYTLCLVLVALAQAGLFVWQLIYMRRGIDDAGVSADAAKKAAQAAVEQVDITRSGTATTERAYVFCEHIEAVGTGEYGTEEVTKWSFTCIWRNSGKTPTQYAVANVNSRYDPHAGELPFDFKYPDYGNKERISIGPNAIMHTMAFDVTSKDLRSIQNNKAKMFIWGWIEYNDIFDGTGRHRSEFCFELVVVGNPIYKAGGFRYRRHGPFNGIDEECFYPPNQ
jgi:hypothetical protein